MNSKLNAGLVFITCLVVASACGRTDDTPSEAAESAMPAAAERTAPPALTRTPAPEGARVYFVTPADGDTVSSPVSVEFAVDGMKVVPAGTAAANSGHHHVIIDADLPTMEWPIPADANHVHFGDGSSSTELTLEPGTHTLQLLFADHLHIPHEPPVVSDRITITVE